MGKAAGRNASEPRRSLVTQLEMPTLWSEGEGRCLRDSNEHPPSGSSGVAGMACGGRDTVQDGRPTTVRGENPQPRRIRENRNRQGPSWESEGCIVPLEGRGQHNLARGKGPYFVHVFRRVEDPGIAFGLSTPFTIRTLQRKLSRKAKPESGSLDTGACLLRKNIGKPCMGKPYARFDEGALGIADCCGSW